MPYRNGQWTRGTSNGNARGSASTRRARRRRLEARQAVDGVLVCWRGCGTPLLVDDVAQALGVPASERYEVDRVVPGALGGRYTDDNVMPACRPCNNETGQAVRTGRVA